MNSYALIVCYVITVSCNMISFIDYHKFHFFILAALSAITHPTGPAPTINKSGFC